MTDDEKPFSPHECRRMLDFLRDMVDYSDAQLDANATRIAKVEAQRDSLRAELDAQDVHICGPCDHCEISNAQAHAFEQDCRKLGSQLAEVTEERDRLRVELRERSRQIDRMHDACVDLMDLVIQVADYGSKHGPFRPGSDARRLINQADELLAQWDRMGGRR